MAHKDDENICLYDKIETERRQLKSELAGNRIRRCIMDIQTFMRIEPAKARVVRIKNILALETIYISEILLKEAE